MSLGDLDSLNRSQPKKSKRPFREAIVRTDGVPKGVRTPVAAVRGRSPGPLDDGDLLGLHSTRWPKNQQ